MARLAESRIRQIIREETLRALREGEFDDFGGGEEVGDPFADEGEMDDEMDEAGDFDAFLTILNASELADAMDMSPEDLVVMLEDIAHRDFRGHVVLTGEDGGGHGPDGPPYSEEYDAIGAMGNRRDLERFVRAVENEIQGPAQSMEPGQGLEYEIQDL